MKYRIEESSGVYGTTPFYTGFYQKKNWFGKLVWKQVYYQKYRWGPTEKVYNFSYKEDVIRELTKLIPYKTKVVETGTL